MNPPDGRSKRAAVQREERRSQILDAALQVFSERGYHATSVTDLVKAAGVARGTFYLYFDGKNAVFLHLLDQLLSRFRDGVTGLDTRSSAAPLREQLVDAITRILATAANSRPLAQIVFREAVALDGEIDDRIRTFERQLLTYLQMSLAQGEAIGWLRAHDAEIVATCVYGSLRQLIQRYVVEDLAELDWRHAATTAVALHLDGLLNPA